jgi:acyl carrier protein
MEENSAERLVVLLRIKEELGTQPVSVTAETEFSALDVDSLEFVDLCQSLERAFDLTIPDEAIANVNTVGDLCRVVEALRTARPKEISDYVSG